MTMSIRSLFFFFLFVIVATISAGTNQEGLDFLAKKATEDSVVKLESGLMYKGEQPNIRYYGFFLIGLTELFLSHSYTYTYFPHCI
jgi:hypothetical protein